jgi:hypothetical protein
MLAYTRTIQGTRFSERGQQVDRLTFDFGQTTFDYMEVGTVGVPATPADCGFLRIPLGLSGRIISFGLTPVLALTGAVADGTVTLDAMPYTPAGGGAFANIANIVLGATAAGYMVPGGVEARTDNVALAPALAPYAFTGGETLCAYVSIIRTVVSVGRFYPWIEVIYDQTPAAPTAAAAAVLNTA